MWKVCQWLCPKRKKKEAAYDVHEDTFEMDEQIGDIEQHDKHESQAHVETPHVGNKIQSEEVLNPYLDQKQAEEEEQAENEKKFMETKNKIDETPMPSTENEKKFMENKMKVEEQPPKELQPEPKPQPIQQKPSYLANILNPKKSIKKKPNPEDFRFVNQSDSFKVKKPNTLLQQQFNIDNCKNCSYFIFDITANVYIDDSENCFIFIGPCESTIFVRNCKNMVIVAVTGQFRTFECHNCHFSVFCKSQPVIQSSSNLHFSSFMCPEYEEFGAQLKKLKREGWNNHWSEIHNFTKKEGEIHYTLHRHPTHEMEVNWEKAFDEAGVKEVAKQQTFLPFIQGKLPIQPSEVQHTEYLIIFSQQYSENSQQLLKWVQNNKILLLQASKSKFKGHGNDELVAMKIQCPSDIELDFQSVGSPIVYRQKEEIETKQGNYFINFGDQRQK